MSSVQTCAVEIASQWTSSCKNTTSRNLPKSRTLKLLCALLVCQAVIFFFLFLSFSRTFSFSLTKFCADCTMFHDPFRDGSHSGADVPLAGGGSRLLSSDYRRYDSPHWRPVVAEFFGTSFFVFGAVTSSEFNHRDELSANALATALSLMTAIAITGPISGAHLNPAVSFAAALCRRIDILSMIAFFFAQFAGAICGAALCKSMVWHYQGSLGAVEMASGTSDAQAFVCELVLTTVLIIVYLSVSVDPVGGEESPLAPVLIGMTVAGDILVGGWISGACMNPARALGPAVVANIWSSDMWVYFSGPFTGAIVAVVLWAVIMKPRRPVTTLFTR